MWKIRFLSVLVLPGTAAGCYSTRWWGWRTDFWHSDTLRAAADLLLKVKQKKREQSSKPRWNVLPYIITSDALVVPLSLPSQQAEEGGWLWKSYWRVGRWPTQKSCCLCSVAGNCLIVGGVGEDKNSHTLRTFAFTAGGGPSRRCELGMDGVCEGKNT